MNRIAKTASCVALSASLLLGAKVPGLPAKFTFSVNPFRGGTAWFLPADEGRLYRDAFGKAMCEFLGDLRFPAYYEPRMDAYYCPGVTVRHIYSTRIARADGKCEGFVCGYDIAIPGGGAMLTTDKVEYCPDIIVTVGKAGRMDVVAAKTFKSTEDPTPYFYRGKLTDLSLVTEPLLVDKCGGPRYRRQVEFWLGTVSDPSTEIQKTIEDDARWDGF